MMSKNLLFTFSPYLCAYRTELKLLMHRVGAICTKIYEGSPYNFGTDHPQSEYEYVCLTCTLMCAKFNLIR